jgi:hypothetical protein
MKKAYKHAKGVVPQRGDQGSLFCSREKRHHRAPGPHPRGSAAFTTLGIRRSEEKG